MSKQVHIDLNSGVVLFGSAVVPCLMAGTNGEVRVDGGCLLRPLPFAERTRLTWLAAMREDAEAVLAESVLVFTTVEPAERRAYDDVVALVLAGAGEEGTPFDETLVTAARATGLSLDELLMAPARAVDALARPEDGSEWNRIFFPQPMAEANWASMRAEFCRWLLRRLHPASVWGTDISEVSQRAPVRPRERVVTMDTQATVEAALVRPVIRLWASRQPLVPQTEEPSKASAPLARSPSGKGVHMGERPLPRASGSLPAPVEISPLARFSFATTPPKEVDPAASSPVPMGDASPVLMPSTDHTTQELDVSPVPTPHTERMTLSVDASSVLAPRIERTNLPMEVPPTQLRGRDGPERGSIRWIHRPASTATVDTPSVQPTLSSSSLTDIADLIGEMLHHEADLRGID